MSYDAMLFIWQPELSKLNTTEVRMKTISQDIPYTTAARIAADMVKKAWCAYYDPDRMSWGKPSRCVKCCVNNNDKKYDPSLIDRECKHWERIGGCLPTLREVLGR